MKLESGPRVVLKFAIKKKLKTKKCSNHCTVSLIAHTANIVVRILRQRFERKTEDVLRNNQFRFRTGKGTQAIFPTVQAEHLRQNAHDHAHPQTQFMTPNLLCFNKML
jgi:hypothetical protein